MNVPPKGSMLRAHAELGVRLRQAGRVIRSTPAWHALERQPWWLWHVLMAVSAVGALLLGDPGFMLLVAVLIGYGLWVRR